MKKLLSLILAVMILCGALAAAVFAEKSPFVDVKTSRWSYKAVLYAKEKGYMDGIGNGKFDPAGNVTRGMAVTVLYRREGSPETEWRDDFTDVKSGKYYSKAVIWAKDNGIVNGVTATSFDPNGMITREQLAAIFYRYGQYGGVDVSGRADLSVFPDAGKAHKYAMDALACVVDYGLITGMKSGDRNLLDPLGTATREQFATILMRLDEKFPAEKYEFVIDGGRFVKPFDPDSTDAYVQAVADAGRDFVTLSFFSTDGTAVSFDGAESSKKAEHRVDLTDGYGYTEVLVDIRDRDGNTIRKFSLMILKPADRDVLYGLKNRPQFHYTPPYGYMNDPNGLVYNAATGEYHLFYQAYPYSQDSVIKHWGHAVTHDLVTFEEKPTALYPDSDGYAMWSGSGFIDYNNVSGLYDEKTPPEARMILAYYLYRDDDVLAGLAYTEDGGETWIKAQDGRTLNFIGPHPTHIDPKVLWVEKLGKWLLAGASGEMLTSDNLWDWRYAGTDTGGECPDLFRIEVEETGEKKYVRSYAGTYYRVGDLAEDGSGKVRFVPETGDLTLNGGCLDRAKEGGILSEFGWFSGKSGSFYATQHYSDVPDGRIVSVSWLIEKGLDATGTWAGALTVATELKLHERDGQYYLTSYPVSELSAQRGETLYSCENKTVSPGDGNILDGVVATYADVDGVFVPGEGVTEFGFRLREGDGGYITVKYDVIGETLTADFSMSGDDRYNGVRSMKLALPEDGRIPVRILLDSIILECFGGNGEAAVSSVFSRPEGYDGMSFFTTGGSTLIEEMKIYEMRSIW